MEELDNINSIFNEFEKINEMFQESDMECEQHFSVLKNKIRRFKRSSADVGLWSKYRKLNKDDKKQFVQDFMAEFNCSMVTVYNYINRRKPIKQSKLERIKKIFAKYGINEK